MFQVYNGKPINFYPREEMSEHQKRGFIKNERYIAPISLYRDRLKSMQILLSMTQAGPGRAVKHEQEEISRNQVQTF